MGGESLAAFPHWIVLAACSTLLWFVIELIGRKTWFTDELAAFGHSFTCMVLTGATVMLDVSTGRDIYCFCSCAIEPPWTATILPAVTMGYGFYDLLIGIHRHARWDYSMHGVVLILACGAVCVSKQAHQVTYMMLMEWSTVFLNLRRLKSIYIDFMFALLFFVIRIGVVPFVWTKWMYRFSRDDTNTSCIATIVPWAALFGGIILHVLNIYWARFLFIKVRKKVRELAAATADMKKEQ